MFSHLNNISEKAPNHNTYTSTKRDPVLLKRILKSKQSAQFLYDLNSYTPIKQQLCTIHVANNELSFCMLCYSDNNKYKSNKWSDII